MGVLIVCAQSAWEDELQLALDRASLGQTPITSKVITDLLEMVSSRTMFGHMCKAFAIAITRICTTNETRTTCGAPVVDAVLKCMKDRPREREVQIEGMWALDALLTEHDDNAEAFVRADGLSVLFAVADTVGLEERDLSGIFCSILVAVVSSCPGNVLETDAIDRVNVILDTYTSSSYTAWQGALFLRDVLRYAEGCEAVKASGGEERLTAVHNAFPDDDSVRDAAYNALSWLIAVSQVEGCCVCARFSVRVMLFMHSVTVVAYRARVALHRAG